MTVRLHDGVRLRQVCDSVRVRDEATEVDVVLPARLFEEFVIRNELVRRPGARRLTAPAGLRNACATTVLAIARTWGIGALALGSALAICFSLVRAPGPLVVGGALAPLLLLLVVIAHEAAHWTTLRLIRSRTAGAIVVGWRTCEVQHAELPGWQGRAVSAAGPSTGLVVSATISALVHDDLAIEWTAGVLVVVNLLGFTPLTLDGRRLLASNCKGRRRSPSTARRSSAARPGIDEIPVIPPPPHDDPDGSAELHHRSIGL